MSNTQIMEAREVAQKLSTEILGDQSRWNAESFNGALPNGIPVEIRAKINGGVLSASVQIVIPGLDDGRDSLSFNLLAGKATESLITSCVTRCGKEIRQWMETCHTTPAVALYLDERASRGW